MTEFQANAAILKGVRGGGMLFGDHGVGRRDASRVSRIAHGF